MKLLLIFLALIMPISMFAHWGDSPKTTPSGVKFIYDKNKNMYYTYDIRNGYLIKGYISNGGKWIAQDIATGAFSPVHEVDKEIMDFLNK